MCVDASAPLKSTLKELQVGGKPAEFPIEREGSVRASVSTLRKELKRIGWDVVIDIDYDNYKVIVRRTR